MIEVVLYNHACIYPLKHICKLIPAQHTTLCCLHRSTLYTLSESHLPASRAVQGHTC